jgi:hypothetical protein
MLNLIDSFQILKSFPIAQYKIIKNEKDLQKLDFPCWLKASIWGHKTEEKAVFRAKDKAEAEKSLKQLRKKFPTDTIIAQEEIDGMHMILGLKQDKVFGKLLLVGFGGTFTEVVRDISFRSVDAGINKTEIQKQLSELKLYPALVSRKKYAVDKLVSLAEKLANSNIKEADLNPVILTDKDAFIVDARVEV